MNKIKQCYFCVNNKELDYKDTETLKKFLTPQARIVSKKQSEICAKHQRRLSEAVKRSRFLALLPFVAH